MFIHLGDVEGGEDYLEAVVECEKHIIRGNNDFFTELPREEEFEIGPYHAFITHGHYYYVSMGMETIIEEGRSRGADLVFPPDVEKIDFPGLKLSFHPSEERKDDVYDQTLRDPLLLICPLL